MLVLARLRTRALALLHLVLFAAAYCLAFALRFDFDLPDEYEPLCVATLPLAAGIKFVAFYAFGQYRAWLRYLSVHDLKRIIAAASAAAVAFVVVERFLGLSKGVPRSIFVLDWGLTVVLVSSARLAARLVREGRWLPSMRNDLRKILIVGAGDAGEGLLRELRRRPELSYLAVGFLEDDPGKQGARIGGLPVLGTTDDAAAIAEAYDVREAIVAIPSASGAVMRRIVGKLRRAGLSFKTLPGVSQIMGGRIDARQIREVTIEELLGRAPVDLDLEAIGRLIRGRTVAVTGAAGSIGSELCLQCLRFAPAKLVLVDWAENGLFWLERTVRERAADVDAVPCLADVRDPARIASILDDHAPDLVFHAAAHKHVPMMERNPCEAAMNNVFGTKAVADASVERGVGAFVLISTDKAANPVSVMGMTKRVAELYVHALGEARKARLSVVRFGNVLGSAGSVVPIFREQIERGGPVTVTDPEMTRYFMTIPEAVQLVLQATVIGGPGDILVLDMGEPVKIVDLARELIALSGLREPDHIEIAFTGPRPGEKLTEELFGSGEEVAPSAHESIRLARGPLPGLEALAPALAALRSAAEAGDDEAVRRLLAELTAPAAAGTAA